MDEADVEDKFKLVKARLELEDTRYTNERLEWN